MLLAVLRICMTDGGTSIASQPRLLPRHSIVSYSDSVPTQATCVDKAGRRRARFFCVISVVALYAAR